MYLIRDIMYCKPGKVRPMVERFVKMAALSEKLGMGKMRIMTDVCAERYWMLVSEMEVESMAEFDAMMSGAPPKGATPDDLKQFEELMKGYHDLVDHGKREIYKIES